MLLPHIEKADIAVTKLTSYVLNAYHPEGRHKARVFLSALDVTIADAQWLADTILSGLWLSEAVLQRHTNWGTIYHVDMKIVHVLKCAKVRTGWLCTTQTTRLITCFVIGECDETI